MKISELSEAIHVIIDFEQTTMLTWKMTYVIHMYHTGVE